MNPTQLLDYMIRPTLAFMGEKYADPKAAVLLLATCAQESHCGKYLHQINGPALGIFQIEPGAHNLVWTWAQEHAPTALPSRRPPQDALIYDLRYACIIARLLYYSWPDALPESNPDACYVIYKKCFNSATGAATVDQFRDNWNQYVAGAIARSPGFIRLENVK